MIFKAKYARQGGHITVVISSAISSNHTFANLGVLTMDERDWDSFRRSVNGVPSTPDGWQFEEREQKPTFMDDLRRELKTPNVAAT